MPQVKVLRSSALLLAFAAASCTGEAEPLPSSNDPVELRDAQVPAPDGGQSAHGDAAPPADGATGSGPDGSIHPPSEADAAVDAGEEQPGCTGELCPADITFFAMGDPQYGGGSADQNYFHVTALNNFPGRMWPEGMPSAGTPVAEPRGLLVAGDLTQNGKDGRPENNGTRGRNELGQFLSDYGLTGSDGLLRFPVYEGYGNHDFDPSEPFDANPTDWRYYYPELITPGVQAVIDRNLDRPGLVNVQNDGGHYSWDWGGVHFVNVNLFPGNEPSNVDVTSGVRNPHRSLDFLAQDLAAHVGDSCRPVIIMSHYGFSGSSLNALWWKDEQREAFWEVAKNYNVIAYVHGHQHDTSIGSWNGMDYFNVGSPYYATENLDGYGHFSVFRIHDDVLEAADARWSPKQAGLSPEFPAMSAPNTGWRFSKQFKRSCAD
jgi:cytolysin (calcineurin-like family phosphatase)